MIPRFTSEGLLPLGVRVATWPEFKRRFGTNPRRRRLVEGLALALASLKEAGCRRVYVDGSFVTKKARPNDFDACWAEAGVDPDLLHPALLSFENLRARQKAAFLGELFPASASADEASPFLKFFQMTRKGQPKGIVALNLRGWKP